MRFSSVKEKNKWDVDSLITCACFFLQSKWWTQRITTNNTLSSLSLFSQNTLYSIEGTQNNREDVSARDDVCALNCARRDERCVLRLKWKREQQKGGQFFVVRNHERNFWRKRERKEKRRKGNTERREKFCFFSFDCLFLGKVIFRCIPLKTSSLILTKPSHNKNNSLSLSLSLSLSPNDFSILFSSSQRVIIVL